MRKLYQWPLRILNFPLLRGQGLQHRVNQLLKIKLRDREFEIMNGPANVGLCHVQHFFGGRGQTVDTVVFSKDHRRNINAFHQIHQITVEPVELQVAVVKILIERRCFFVSGLQFFFGRFEFFIGALKFFIAGQGFFIRGAEFLIDAFMLIDNGLQIGLRRGKLFL